MRFTEFTVRFGFKGKFGFTESAPRDMNTGGPPLVRSPLVQFPLVRILKRYFIRSY